MKKIKLIVASLFSLALVLSCNDDGGDSNLNLSAGAVPNIKKVEGTDALINLLEIQEGNDISISITTTIAQGEVSSADIIGFYFKADDGSYEKVVLANDITTFPSTLTFTKQNLIDAFTSLNGDADFELGDQLRISADLTLPDGRVLGLLKEDGTQNYSPDIANSPLYSVVQNYNVSCPSDLGGTYNYITTNMGEPGGGTAAGPVTGSVTLTDNGGGVYSLSDASFGGWLGLYGPTGGAATGVVFNDICGTISYGGADQFDEIFTITDLVVNGSELSFHWSNDYGEYGDTTLIRPDGSDWPPLVSAE